MFWNGVHSDTEIPVYKFQRSATLNWNIGNTTTRCLTHTHTPLLVVSIQRSFCVRAWERPLILVKYVEHRAQKCGESGSHTLLAALDNHAKMTWCWLPSITLGFSIPRNDIRHITLPEAPNTKRTYKASFLSHPLHQRVFVSRGHKVEGSQWPDAQYTSSYQDITLQSLNFVSSELCTCHQNALNFCLSPHNPDRVAKQNIFDNKVVVGICYMAVYRFVTQRQPTHFDSCSSRLFLSWSTGTYLL